MRYLAFNTDPEWGLDLIRSDPDPVRPDSAPDPDEAAWGRFGGDAEAGSLFRQPAHSRRAQRRAARAAREAWLD